MESEASSLQFARAARTLGHAARAQGWMVPGYRCPPRVLGAERTLRRRPGGGFTVAIRMRGRPWSAVLADMVEGLVVANGLVGPQADRARDHLWAALEADGSATVAA
ncbi:MAG: hypothetical protein S0880_05320 [Actinomycetota bacterium]|nr:hypothetical protein [Actinomycetota bacterium]